MLKIADVKSDDQARVLVCRVRLVFVTAKGESCYNASKSGADMIGLANGRSYRKTFFTAL
jgi:hypothetical protein